jgi:WD40 repeat protein
VPRADGRRLALVKSTYSGTTVNTLEILSLSSGKSLLTIPMQSSDNITALAWSGDGQYLAVGYYQGTLEVWKITSQP